MAEVMVVPTDKLLVVMKASMMDRQMALEMGDLKVLWWVSSMDEQRVSQSVLLSEYLMGDSKDSKTVQAKGMMTVEMMGLMTVQKKANSMVAKKVVWKVLVKVIWTVLWLELVKEFRTAELRDLLTGEEKANSTVAKSDVKKVEWKALVKVI
jgi:hypothetical protein